jgi:hypothetical protein
MHLYARLYEFAASAGALEGYVYERETIDMQALPVWVNNLLDAYRVLPPDVRSECQLHCDQTLGRAIRSLTPVLGESHEVVTKLGAMVKGDLPESADDFQKKKWFQG